MSILVAPELHKPILSSMDVDVHRFLITPNWLIGVTTMVLVVRGRKSVDRQIDSNDVAKPAYYVNGQPGRILTVTGSKVLR